MQVAVSKFAVIGLKSSLEAFFEAAQKAGVAEFVQGKKNDLHKASIEKLRLALKIASEHVPQRIPQGSKKPPQDLPDAIIAERKRLEHIDDEIKELELEHARVAPFGSFSLSDRQFLEANSLRRLFFYSAKEIITDPHLVHVAAYNGLEYFISFTREELQLDGLLFMNVESSVQEIDAKMRAAKKERECIHRKLHELCSFSFESELIALENAQSLLSAKTGTVDELDGALFVAYVYVAQNEEEKLIALCNAHNVVYESVQPQEGEKVPVSFHNEGFSRVGQDLVMVYDTPGPNDRDPSPWVVWIFALFFAIIIGDGGYGCIFLVSALYLNSKFAAAQGLVKRMTKLSLLLAVSCVIWGALNCSFFGIEIGPENPLRKHSLIQYLLEKKADYHIAVKDDVYEQWTKEYPALLNVSEGREFVRTAIKKDAEGGEHFPIIEKFSDNINLELALFLGVIHLILSFLREIDRKWTGFGWIAFMIGGYLYFPAMLNATSLIHFLFGIEKAPSAALGLYMVYGGIAGACLVNIAQNGLWGLLELMNLISVFSDALSYLRLYALGLSGAMMSATFNGIGEALPHVFGLLVIIIGHGVNIGLSIMSGVIHGLRLNFLEWYHYCFEGGGRLLSPLELKKTE